MRAMATRAAGVLCVVAVVLALPAVVGAQRGRGGQGQGVTDPAPPPTGERVSVMTAHANIHAGPTTANEVLVLAPRGAVLPVLARRGEWVQVSLAPELRKTGMVLRWYKNEAAGWIHDSMVEVVKPGAP